MNIRATHTHSLSHARTHAYTYVCAHTYTVTGGVSLTSLSPLGFDTSCAAHANVSQLRSLLSPRRHVQSIQDKDASMYTQAPSCVSQACYYFTKAAGGIHIALYVSHLQAAAVVNSSTPESVHEPTSRVRAHSFT